MTNEETLKKAIEKALHNHWEQMLPFVPTWALEQANEDRLTQHIIKTYGKSIIFSHDFAKAYWGEEEIEEETNDLVAGKRIKMTHGIAWKYHLQQLVLEPEPLKYIEKFL